MAMTHVIGQGMVRPVSPSDRLAHMPPAGTRGVVASLLVDVLSTAKPRCQLAPCVVERCALCRAVDPLELDHSEAPSLKVRHDAHAFPPLIDGGPRW